MTSNYQDNSRITSRAFEVRTVQGMGWGSTKNGALLELAFEDNFTALITADKNIEYQHNLEALPIAIVVLMSMSHRLQDIIPLIPAVIETLGNNIKPGVYRVPI